MKKVKLDPSKIEYDGKGFKAVVTDKDVFKEKLKLLREEVLKDIKDNSEENIPTITGLKK